MRPDGPRYSSLRPDDQRRQRRRAGHQRLAVAVILVVVVVLAIALGIGLSGHGGGNTSTSTSVGAGSTTSGTSTGGSTTSGSATTTLPGSPSTTAGTGPSGTESFSAQLGGDQEVPAVTTSATGSLVLKVSSNGASVSYVLKVSHIANVTVARLHVGAQGKTGGTILTLYNGPTKKGTFTGTLAQGSFTKAALAGPLAKKTITDLVALLKAGSVYVNVGTTAHTTGEIRGQLE
jgi:hypothetical protein